MKSYILPLLSCLILFSCNNKTAGVIQLNANQFQSTIHEDAILLDVRTAEEIASGQIDGARHLNFYMQDFSNKIALIQKEKEVFVYCHSGGRSNKAAKALKELGHPKVYNLDGGIIAWKKNNLPLSKSTRTTSKAHTFSQDSIKNILNSETAVVMAFQTKWCTPCKKMKPIIAELEEEYIGKIQFVKVDLDANTELSEKYSVASIPTFIYFKNGQEVWRKIGFQDKQTLVEIL